MALNERQRKFCEYYAQSGHATDAAIKAGYSASSAGTNADKLLKNTNVSNYLKELTEKARSEAIADITEVKEVWSSILRSTEEETQHRLKAGELLAKAAGGFIDKVEHTGSVVQRIINVNPSKKEKR